jgi:hypothetical protein
MRILRGIGAVLVWLLATVVMVLALVLSITIILLPVGLPLLALGLRLYGYGVQLMIPRTPELKRGLRKRVGLRAHGSLRGDAKRAGKKTRKTVRKKTRGLRSRLV